MSRSHARLSTRLASVAAAAGVVWFVALGAGGTAANANPVDAFSWGARSSGLAGAATAVVDDFSANYYNPAALASDDRLRVDFGYAYVQPFLQLNGGDLDVDAVRGVHGGIVIPGRIWDRVLAFSVGIFLPDERISRIRALPQGQPRFALYDNRPQRLVITTSLAFEVIENLFVGAGLTYVANTKGTLDLDGIISVSDSSDTSLLTAVDVGLESVRYFSGSVLWTPPGWRIGATFRDEFFLDLALDVNVEGTIFLGGIELDQGTLDVVALNANLFSPRQVFVGVARVLDEWLISFDLGWQQWSRFPAPTAEISVDIELESLGFDLPAPDRPIDPNFHDIFVVRLGAEGRVLDTDHVDLTLRGGYSFEPSPAPAQPSRTNYVDADKHTLAMGISLAFEDFTEVLPGPLVFDLSGLGVFLHEREYRKTDPADPIGDYTARGYIAGVTSTVRMLF